MARSTDRRSFLRRTALAGALAALGPSLVVPGRARASSDRLVVAVGQWGTETPFPWRNTQAEKPLWDSMFDPLIMRDPRTFAYRPGLAIEWKPSNEMKTWTFKLRAGVMFHENYGEMTSEDVKYTVEQSFKPDALGGSAYFFRNHLDRIELPDKHTVVMHFKSPQWMVPSLFSQYVGYQNVTSKKYMEAVGEQKASQHPIGTGPYRHVEGKQGDYHRFEAVPNHWRKTPAFKELVIRRIPEVATRLSGLRSGEIDIAQVFGDFLEQAQRAGLRFHENPNAAQYWVIMTGQTTPDREDYCPQCPWVGEPGNPKSLENGRKVRLALNLAVNKKAIMSGLWKGKGSETPYSYYYYPFHKGYRAEWKLPPYDLERAKRLLGEAGQTGGFEVKVNPYVQLVAQDGPDVMEAVALDWERLGLKVQRVPESTSSYGPKIRLRKTGKRFSVYGGPPFDEPVAAWERVLTAKGAFNLLLDGTYDKEIDATVRELDADRRGRLTSELGQKLYESYPGVMLGMKSITWAISRKVGSWQTLAYTVAETNYEYITAAS
jgi:peptide/nickel transport system substrate-binding protein